MSRADCEVLVKLYSSTGGPNWRINTGWNVDNKPCSWYGVTCRDWHVVGLNLSNNNLTGTIPPELSQLTYPEVIVLSSNNLTGPLPSDFGYYQGSDRWLSLTYLSLAYNRLSGQIPASLGQLDNLETLDLSHNAFTGPIPNPTFGTLPKLKYLYLNDNHLEGPIPTGIAYFLYSLRILLLDGNQLSGSVPQYLDRAEILDLSYNKLSGTLPYDFASKYNDGRYVSLRYNMLEADFFTDANLRNHDPQWSKYQTVKPRSKIITLPSPAGSATIQWWPIEYTEDIGGYSIEYKKESASVYTEHGRTPSKTITVYTLTGLDAGKYQIRLRTFTLAHGYQQNDHWSDYTDPITVEVTAASLLPVLTSLDPAVKRAGSSGFTLTATGKNFMPGAVVYWGTTSLQTQYISGTQLTAAVPASLIATKTEAGVRVFNPQEGGGFSRTLAFLVMEAAADGLTAALDHLAATVLTYVDPTYADRNLTLEVPADAGENATQIIFADISGAAPDAPGSFMFAGRRFMILLYADGHELTASTLAAPIRLTIQYPAIPQAAQEDTLHLRSWNSGTNAWSSDGILLVSRDAAKRQIVMDIYHLSQFALFAWQRQGAADASRVILFPTLFNTIAGSDPEDAIMTGVALANLGSTKVNCSLTALDPTGTLITGAGIVNPVEMEMAPNTQIPTIDFQIFGNGFAAVPRTGWMKVASSSSKVTAFFEAFNQTVSMLDGADVSDASAARLVLAEIENAGFTRIHVVNPGLRWAAVTMELVDQNGVVKRQITRNIPPHGAVAESVTHLFPSVVFDASDYIRVTSSQPVSAQELLGQSRKYLAALNAQDAAAGATILYAPQYAVGGPHWRTTLSIVNLEDISGNVTFRLFLDDGNQTTRTVPIRARGKIYLSDQDFFLNAGGNLKQGFVEINGNGLRLAGSAVFGDPGRNSYSSSLPLVSSFPSTFVFSQLASDDTYYTGIALLNPNPFEVAASIEVRDKDGNPIDAKIEKIAAGRRVSLVLTQYFPALAARKISAGYIRITASGGLASFAVFGTHAGTSLSAVPPQLIR